MRLDFWKKESDTSAQSENNNSEIGFSGSSQIQPEASLSSITYSHTAPEDNIYSKISRWSMYLAFFLVPLFFTPLTTSILDTNKQALLILLSGVGLVTWLLSIVSSGWLSWRKNPMDYSILAISLATVVSTIFSVDKFKSLLGTNLSSSSSLFTVIALTLIYFIIVNSFNGKGSALRQVLGLSLIIGFIYGILQLFGIHIIRFPFAVSEGFNTFGGINTLGLLAAISLPFLAKTRFDLKWINKIHLDKLSVLICVAILLVINWWVLWVVAIAGMVGMVVLETVSGSKFKMSNILLPMTIIVLGVFFIIVNVNLSGIRAGFPVEVSPSYGLSMDVSKNVLAKSPIFGFGPDNFSVAFDRAGVQKISDSVLAGARFFDGSSEVFNIVIQLGAIGILALLGLIGSTALVFKKFVAGFINHDDAKEIAGLLASFFAILVALFFYPFNTTLMFMLYALVALSVVSVWSDSIRYLNIEEATSLSLISSLGFIGGLILVLVGSYFGGTSYWSDVKYAQALTGGDTREAAQLMVEAINLNNQDDRYYRSASQVALNLLAQELTNKNPGADSASKIQNYRDTSITLARRATEITPGEALNWDNLGSIYQNLLGRFDNADKLAEEAFKKASELRPGDANYANKTGMVYLTEYEIIKVVAQRAKASDLARLGNQANESLVKAAENFSRAIEISPSFGAAIYNLGAVYDRQGKISEAINELEKVIPANSDKPGLMFELGLLYYRVGRKDDAFNQLSRAVVLSPNYSNARWYLALIQEERGNFEAAIEQLENITSIDSNKGNEVVISKLNQLKEGRKANPPVNVLDQKPIQ